MNINRAKEIVDSGAEAVGVACPFCKTMVSDGIKHFNKDEQIEVLDIAEIVERSLPRPKVAPSVEPNAAGASADAQG